MGAASLPSCLSYQDNRLMMGELSIKAIAEQQATPFYLYSADAIRQRIHDCLSAFSPVGVAVHFAVKSNSNLSVLRLMGSAGLGADIVSGGELTRVLKAGIDPGQVIFSGVAKTDAELRQAVEAGVGQFNVESAEELFRIDRITGQLGVQVNAVLRVNPEVDAGTHDHITTGKKGNKFGIAFQRLSELFCMAGEMPQVNLRGLAMHIGSQIVSIEPYRESVLRMRQWTEQLRAEGYLLDTLDLGGGIGVDYGDGRSLCFVEYANLINEALGGLDISIQLEPGRSLVAAAGVLVTTVVATKQAEPRNFVMLDAGMNDLIRPALYQATHPLIPVLLSNQRLEEPLDVVGPICESTDCFLKDYTLPLPEEGDLMVLTMTGAYSAVLSSTYNSRPLVAEVMLEHTNIRVIRKAWTLEEQLRLEE
ncbi:diaminopimelate decarboxylase [Motiliproteus sp. MSK22-1]|nr:diaminopimelate decarboxylase [Motiliproteus sp. MSK22-1]